MEGEKIARLSYHCFIYHMYNSVMYIVMSTSVFCHEFVRSPKEGQLTMELTEDVYGWPASRCVFPIWFSAHAWRDINGAFELTFTNGNDVMLRRHRGSTHPPNGTSPSSSSSSMVGSKQTTFKCLHVNEVHIAEFAGLRKSANIFVQVLENCQTMLRCIRLIYYRDEPPYLIQMNTGNNDDVGDSENCSDESVYFENSTQLFVRKDLEVGSCPFTGRYTSPPAGETGCQLEMESGCKSGNQSRMVLRSSCQKYPILQLECIKWWSVQQKLFLLARQRIAPDTYNYSCYSFWPQNNSMQISQEIRCDFAAAATNNNNSQIFDFYYRLDHCQPLEVEVKRSWQKQSPAAAKTTAAAAAGGADNDNSLAWPAQGMMDKDKREEKNDKELNDAETSPKLNHLQSASPASRINHFDGAIIHVIVVTIFRCAVFLGSLTA